jgi:hypothetical protein
MSNKQMNGSSLLLSKQKQKDRYRSAVNQAAKNRVGACEKPEATVAFLLEQVSKIL